MFGRIRSLLRRLLLLLLLLATLADGASSSSETQSSIQPRFVLVEEHHHIVSHLVDFSREGYLRSHNQPPIKERNSQHGAILLHIDSHADMGAHAGLAKSLPYQSLFSELPSDIEDQHQLLEHSVISDFLVLLGYMGIVDHIIFVEPPWSLLLRDAHYTTVDISMGVATDGGETTVFASIRNSTLRTTFAKNELSQDAEEALIDMMKDDDEPVEIVSHQDLLDYCDSDDSCQLRTIQFTTLPLDGAGTAISELLESIDRNHDRDLILDIDLDGFSTTSPGAQSLYETTIPDYGVLSRLYHTVHSTLCDMEDKDYWKQQQWDTASRSSTQYCNSRDLSFVHGPGFEPEYKYIEEPLDDPIAVSKRLRSLVNNILDELDYSKKWDKDIQQALAKVLEYYLPILDATVYDDDQFVRLTADFLRQPFFVPESESTIDAVMDVYFHQIFRVMFVEDRAPPKVVNIVRSPYYTPDHHLEFIECEVLERLVELSYEMNNRNFPTLYHADEIHVDRTNCEYFPLSHRINTGTNPHETEEWRENTEMVYSLFYEEEEEDDTEEGSFDYRFDPIDVSFTNEHEYSLLLKRSNVDDTPRVVLPGERLMDPNVYHLTRWDLFKAEETQLTSKPSILKTIVFNGKHGDQQSYGSITGRRIPEDDSANGQEL